MPLDFKPYSGQVVLAFLQVSSTFIDIFSNTILIP